ncbi:MAG TPA: carbohydrate-binding family 9-like protein [Candidatus Syntrophosphaera sp.]|nr:carbohydrate-binding family 9-like protein [Candidatus Syntrophosphaera sp.]HPH60050.1 carbohydrate-binding family 9-like protein [Candidatus Syntrophosphaera sp.]
MRPKILAALLLTLCGTLFAETFPVPGLPFAPLSYPCFPAPETPRIDGWIDDPAWAAAPWSASFTDIEGSLKPSPHLDTKFKMLWDGEGLYIAARLEEPQLWATLTEHDAVIFWDNDFEVFLDPNGDTHHYFELEINALNTLWDLFLVQPYRDEHSSLNGWEAHGAETAVGLEGTLNDPSDLDTAWNLEIFLPWQAVAELAGTSCPPRSGDYWRINFSRVQWTTEVAEGNYRKVAGIPEFNWVWSPQGLINMHYPERWGLVWFMDAPSPDRAWEPSLPEILPAEEYLRQVYYAQKQHLLDHGSYSISTSELGLAPFHHRGKIHLPRLEATSRSFCATLETGDLPTLVITQSGRLIRLPLR